MPQKPVRRNVPQGAHNTPNTAARDRALQAEEMRKKRYYRRKRRAENLAYALRIFLLALAACAVFRAYYRIFCQARFCKVSRPFFLFVKRQKGRQIGTLKKGYGRAR